MGLTAKKAVHKCRLKGGQRAVRGGIGDRQGDDWNEDGLECGSRMLAQLAQTVLGPNLRVQICVLQLCIYLSHKRKALREHWRLIAFR